MKQTVIVTALAIVSAFATGVAVGSSGGSGDTQEVAAGVAVFTGLLAIAIPLLALTKNNE